MIRELLTAASGALIAYGIGTTGLWEEASGGVMALVMLIWAVRANAGREQWLTLGRKTISAVGGVLIATGALTPDKVDAILGVALSTLSLGWTMFKLPAPSVDETGPST